MEPLKEVNRIIIHHNERKEDFPEFIQARHLLRGFEDIGYHFLIGNGELFTEDGKLYPGRSERFWGAHAKSHNHDSISICVIGNFDNDEPTEKQLKTLLNFLKIKMKQHDLSPENIMGHRELKGTTKTCPGKNIDLDKIRTVLKDS